MKFFFNSPAWRIISSIGALVILFCLIFFSFDFLYLKLKELYELNSCNFKVKKIWEYLLFPTITYVFFFLIIFFAKRIKKEKNMKEEFHEYYKTALYFGIIPAFVLGILVGIGGLFYGSMNAFFIVFVSILPLGLLLGVLFYLLILKK